MTKAAGGADETVHVLLVEHEQADAELCLAELRRAGFTIHPDVAGTPEEFTARLRAGSYDIVLADYRLPGWTGMDALAAIQEHQLDLPLILVTGTLGDELTVECMKQGAADCVFKGNLARLPLAVRRALAEKRAREERVRADDLIRKLTLAVDQSAASVIITDTAGTIEYVNQRFTQVTGYAAEEALGKNPRLLKSDHTRAEVYRDMWRTIRNGQVWHGEIQNRRKGGELYWDSVSISPIRNATGTVAHFLATQEDITERKEAERAIREREERFRQLADNIKEVFYVIDAQYRETLYINPAYEEVWGRSCHDLYQNPRAFLDPVLPEDRERLIASIAQVQQGRDPGEIEFRVIRPDGQIRSVLSHAVPIRNERGEVYRIAGVALDITERHRSEETIRRLTLAVEQGPAAVVITDTTGKIEYVNRKFSEITGYPAAAVLGKNPKILRSGRTRLETYRDLWTMITAGLEWRGEIQNRKQGGQLYWSAMTISAVRNAAGTITHFLAIQEDVTERRRLEEQFRQSQKMEAVGRLAGGVAHDFNNLLTVITGYSEMLLADLGPSDPRRADVAEIHKAGATAATLTRQLLAFSRQQVLELKVLDLNSVVSGAEKILRRLIGEDVTLVTTLSPDLGAVRADPGQIEQVIMNLAVNARDAMPQGGKLTIETANIELDANYAAEHTQVSPGRYVLLAVSDTGVGMDEQTTARIFEPFFTTKEQGKGTGLGLATVYGIVKQSEGFIWVYSEPGQGATFKVYLPRAPARARAEGEPVAAPEVPRGTETVLLAEDAAAVRSVARQVLERYGYTVLEAAGGKAALDLEARRRGPIHLLLTDVVMPEMSGRQLADKLQTLRPQIKILFISGYTDDAIVRHGVLQATTAYLQKPFAPEALARKVREVLDKAPGP